MPVRVTAVGFILSILFGNLWLVYILTGGNLPNWIGYGFYLGVGLALGGGLATGVRAMFVTAAPDPHESEE